MIDAQDCLIMFLIRSLDFMMGPTFSGLRFGDGYKLGGHLL